MNNSLSTCPNIIQKESRNNSNLMSFKCNLTDQVKEQLEPNKNGNQPATNYRLTKYRSVESAVGRDSKDTISESKVSISRELSCLNISRSPINCPVFTCSEIVGATSLLSHFVRDHIIHMAVNFESLVRDQRAILLFNVNNLKTEENFCCGIIAYGGCNPTEHARPATIGMSLRNAFLPDNYLEYANHLPILIMACKTTLTALLKTEVDSLNGTTNSADEILVLWLATAKTTKPLYGTITVLNSNMTKSRSALVKTRCLSVSQNPRYFMHEESNYLMLTHEELNVFVNHEDSAVELEIFIHEFE